MKITSHIPWVLCIGTAIIFTAGFRHYSSTREGNPFFSTEKAQQRNIISTIQAPGILRPLEILRLGNLINGTVRSLYVEENTLVKEGQLLAEIDDGREDTDVNGAFANLDATQTTRARVRGRPASRRRQPDRRARVRQPISS